MIKSSDDYRLVRISTANSVGTNPFHDEGVIKLVSPNGRTVFSAPYGSGGIAGHTAAPMENRTLRDNNEIYTSPNLQIPALHIGYGAKILHQDLTGGARRSWGCLVLDSGDMDRFIRKYNGIPDGLEPDMIEVTSGKGLLKAGERKLGEGLGKLFQQDKSDENDDKAVSKRNKDSEDRPKLFKRSSDKDDDKDEKPQKKSSAREDKPKAKERDQDDDTNALRELGKGLKQLGEKLKNSGSGMRDNDDDDKPNRPNAGRSGKMFAHR